MSALAPDTPSSLANGGPETAPLAPTMTEQSAPTSEEKLRVKWRERIADARQARLPYERTMLSDLAFASGQHWLVYDENRRQMRHIAEVDPSYEDRELVTADRITELREAALGELEGDDDRPELLVAQEGQTAEEVANQLNQAVDHAWKHEWDAQEVLSIARPWCVDMGVAAIRCRWDPDEGQPIGHAPIHPETGEPLDADEIVNLATNGRTSDGYLPKFRQVREGATCWEAYSALHILPPPGVTHERYFPHFALARPVPISEVEELYPQVKGKLTEDGDIANLAGVTTAQQTRTGQSGANRLRGHVWVFTCFEKPNAKNPQGQVVTLASNSMVLCDQDVWEYQLPDGTYHHGVVFLHWRRRSDRFWSAGFITNLKDPQRIINRRETQNLEIIDRGMPRTWIEKGSLDEWPKGTPHEILQLKASSKEPQETGGIGPGAWMYEDITHQVDNLSHASTIAAIRLGENPVGVDTYAQLALLNDNETSKRVRTFRDHRRQIATLVELGVYDIRKYWGDEKQIWVAGAESQIGRVMFQKARIPDFFMVAVADGAPEPRSQGALLKMLDAIWAAAVQAWVAVNDGQAWVEWYAESIKAGKPLDLPGAKSDTQRILAYLENEQMLDEGTVPPVMEYDNMTMHLPVHREAEDQARASGNAAAVQAIETHIQQHIQAAQKNAAQLQAVQSGEAPPAAGALPSPGAPGSAQPAANPYANYVPRPREPMPYEVEPQFNRVASGQ